MREELKEILLAFRDEERGDPLEETVDKVINIVNKANEQELNLHIARLEQHYTSNERTIN
jgi:hypothetical protein